MSFAIWHGRHLNILFNALLLWTVGVSACDAQAEVVMGLDWIGLFRVVIPNLHTEPSIDEEVEMVSDSTPSVRTLFACRIVICCHLFLAIISIICLPIDPSKLKLHRWMGTMHETVSLSYGN